MTVPVDPEQDPPAPKPAPVQPRIGDAERDRAVGFLQEHMAQGRLDSVEFDERLDRALHARTAADLQPLFDDLPEPRPETGLAVPSYAPPPWASASPTPVVPSAAAGASAVPAPTRGSDMPTWARLLLGGIWPLTILVYIGTDFDSWWLFIAAALITYVLRGAFGSRSKDEKDPPALGR